ncbi:aldo/keto reductase [Oribacterium sp. NK2B42]|uniref:aldo/keto reductase n=1 Tax=Oribacterium sp. NK2B42 TaxID=689781 RepID=UPI000492B9EA|nr:aldo/keto reductase [Oribacterium sp. NK2B42]
MIKRILGKDLEVSAIGLGCIGLSQSYPPFPKKEEGIRFLRRAVEMGQTFFDTSEAYAAGENEELVGEALAPVRDQVKIATKFGWDIQDGKIMGLDSRPGTIRKAMDASLKRLKTDHIDRILDGHTVIGARYSEATERLTDRS